jgi:hypothetical protein
MLEKNHPLIPWSNGEGSDGELRVEKKVLFPANDTCPLKRFVILVAESIQEQVPQSVEQ